MGYTITSSQNPKIKHAISLKKSSVRKRGGLFFIEGTREIRLALLAGYKIQTVYICPEIWLGNRSGKHDENSTGTDDFNDLIGILTGQAPIIETKRNVFSKLVYREGSGGMVVVAHQKKLLLENLDTGSDSLILVVESVEKPGNLGAILRTADAAGVDAVLVCDGFTDIYNPNVVRSSLGSLFTLTVVCCTSLEAARWLKSKQIKIVTTSLTASVPYYLADFRGPSAIVSGAESTGVSGIWEKNSDANIIIPMFGSVDSMNVSVATSIVLYEALRQRGFRKHLIVNNR
jgi:RNA methyltransferase, TrmH family